VLGGASSARAGHYYHRPSATAKPPGAACSAGFGHRVESSEPFCFLPCGLGGLMRTRRSVPFLLRGRDEPDWARRRALTGASACAATLLLPEAFAQPGVCTVTPDSGEGPFYFDPGLVRSDVADGRPGAPLEFAVQVQ